MYTDGTEDYTEKYIQQWADLEAISIPELLSKYSIKETEGKTTVPGETTPPTEPVKTTAAGDSSLADTSLESQELPDEFFWSRFIDEDGSETKTVENLNQELVKYGLMAVESAGFMDGFTIKKIDDLDPAYEAPIMTSEGILNADTYGRFERPQGSILENLGLGGMFGTSGNSVNMGLSGMGGSNLVESAEKVAEIVSRLGNTNYLNEVEEDLGATYVEWKEQNMPRAYTEEEQADMWEAETDQKINSFFNGIVEPGKITQVGIVAGSEGLPQQYILGLDAFENPDDAYLPKNQFRSPKEDDISLGDGYYISKESEQWFLDNNLTRPEQIKDFLRHAHFKRTQPDFVSHKTSANEGEINQWYREWRNDKIVKRVNEYEGSDKVKMQIKALAFKEQKTLLSERKEFYKIVKNLDTKKAEVENLINIATKSQDPIDQVYAIIAADEYNNTVDKLITYQDNLEKTQDDLVAFNQAYNAYRENANIIDRLGNSFRSSIQAPLDLYGTVTEMVVGENKFSETITRGAKDYKAKQATMPTAPSVEEAFDSWEQAGDWAANAFINAAPSLATIYASRIAKMGEFGLITLSAGSAGSAGQQIKLSKERAAMDIVKAKNYLEQHPNISEFERLQVEKRIAEASRILGITTAETLGKMGTAAAAEYIFEKFGTDRIFKNAADLAKAVPAKTLKESGKRVIKSWANGFKTEGVTEFLTETANNIYDVFVLDENKNIFEGGLESFAQGAIVGTGIATTSTPQLLLQGYASEIASREEMAEMNAILTKLRKITGLPLKGAEDLVKLKQQGPQNLDPEVRKLVSKLTQEHDALVNKVVGKIGTKYGRNLLFKLGEINRQIREEVKDFEHVMANAKSYSPSQLKEIKDNYKNKVDKLNQERETLLAEEGFTAEELKSIDEGRSKQLALESSVGYTMYQQAMHARKAMEINSNWKKLSDSEKKKYEDRAEAKKSKTGEPETGRSIYYKEKMREAIFAGKENAENFAKDNLKGDFEIKSFEGDQATEEMLEELEAAGYFEIEGNPSKKEIRNRLNGKGGKITEATVFESNGKNFIFVHIDNAIRNGRVGVFAHEVLHALVAQEMGSSKEISERGENLLKWLQKNDPDLYAIVKDRVDSSYTEVDASGNIVKDENYNEEIMTAMSDAIADGYTPSVKTLTRIRGFISSFLPAKLAKALIDSGGKEEATFHFINNFANRANFNRGIRTNPIKFRFISDEELNKKSQRASAESRSSLFDAINEARPDKAETQGDFQSDPGFTELYMLMQPGQAIHNYVVSKFPGQADKIRAVIESLEERLINFDPQSKRKGSNEIVGAEGITEFLMANINFATLDANKRLAQEAAREKQTTSTESEGAQQIASEDTAPSETLSERPEYKSLIRRRVVSEEVLQTLKGKTIRIVSLLKSRIDAKISNNVTITPLIREIKKQAGKMLDIDFKKAMGGKKDGELRKFLLRNKAAILENMTTTWLSQAIPMSIQKKVDGIWTSDWQGKKVDRETMSTDLAGRTSGADLVRRVPNGARVISDADFLAAFLDSNGNPLRGKKESLAKAMAEEMAFDIIKDSFDNDGNIAEAIIENQKRNGVENAENIGPEFKRQAERGNAKFSEGFDLQLGETTLEEIIQEYHLAKDIFEKDTLTKYYFKNALKRYGIDQDMYDFSKEEDVTKYIETLKTHVLPLLPKEVWFRPEKFDENGNVTKFGKRSCLVVRTKQLQKKIPNPYGTINNVKTGESISLYNIVYHRLITEIRDSDFNNYGDPIILNGKPLTPEQMQSKNYDVYLKDADNVRETKEKIKEYNDIESAIFKAMWENVAKKLQDANKLPKSEKEEIYKAIFQFFSVSTYDMQHPQRTGAIVTMFHKDFGKGNLEREHSFPNLAVMAALFEYAVNDYSNFNTMFSYVANNYRLTVVDKTDKKLIDSQQNIFGYGMGADFNLVTGNFWARYFNGNKKSIDGVEGQLDPKNYELIYSDQTLYEAVPIKPDGTFEDERIQKLIEKWAPIVGPLVEQGIGTARQLAGKLEEQRVAQIKGALMRETAASKQSQSAQGFGNISTYFNEMIERKAGISADDEFSRVRGQLAGKRKGRFKFFIAPGAEDFRGLIHYAFAGKGKQGDRDMQFFEEVLMKPYFKGIAIIDSLRQQIKREFKIIAKEYKAEHKMLKQNIPGTPFTYDQALRVYMWDADGTKIPGISESDKNLMIEAIRQNPNLINFAEALLITGQSETWPKPSEYWEGESLLSDLNNMTEKIGRKEILAEFIENADILFSEENLNKIEAAKGRKHREAIEDALYAMKNGSNRPSGANRQLNKWLNWINGSTGAIMFFNRRSALLQMLSFTNFINWSDNNPLKASAAFANQAQYWKDFAFIFNSDKLKERRGGLKQDVSDSELAQVASRSKNSPQAIIAYLLKIGFKPTQLADSLAIATGGAAFYRNRVNTYLKQGMSQEAAQEQAFLDFSMKSDEAQQSSDPALVSQEQRSVLGRLVLAFANTPMQYTRLMKKAGLDLINGRGDWKTNVSKIAYYGFVQNFIFSALQSALFALAFDDDDEELDEKAAEKKAKNEQRKISNTINSMMDTVLRGSGVYGAVASTIKNVVRTYYAQEEKGFMADHTYTIINIFNVSPPIGSKLKKVYGAIQTKKFEKDSVAARGWALTADGKLNIGPNWAIAGQLTSAAFNLPLDRVVDELKSVSEALDARNKAWQRIALALGWKTWDVGVRNEEADLIKLEAQERRKKEGIEKRKETIRKKKEQKGEEEKNLTLEEQRYLIDKELGLIE